MLLLLPILAWFAGPQVSASELLPLAAAQAERVVQRIPRALSRETLEQRVFEISRQRPSKGRRAEQAYRSRTVISEYTIAPLTDSGSGALYEYRQAVSVDGSPVQSAESARHALSLGVRSEDDRLRKRMMEDFASHGLSDVATDYALVLLLFTGSGQRALKIRSAGAANIGAESALGFAWSQLSDKAGQLSFAGRVANRVPLSGVLWVRASDGMPLRVEAQAEQKLSGRKVRDEATVDYVMSSHGFAVPVSVHHRHLVDGQVRTENLYRYGPFQMLGPDAQGGSALQ